VMLSSAILKHYPVSLIFCILTMLMGDERICQCSLLLKISLSPILGLSMMILHEHDLLSRYMKTAVTVYCKKYILQVYQLQVLFIGIVFTPLEYEGFETLNHAIIFTVGNFHVSIGEPTSPHMLKGRVCTLPPVFEAEWASPP